MDPIRRPGTWRRSAALGAAGAALASAGIALAVTGAASPHDALEVLGVTVGTWLGAAGLACFGAARLAWRRGGSAPGGLLPVRTGMAWDAPGHPARRPPRDVVPQGVVQVADHHLRLVADHHRRS